MVYCNRDSITLPTNLNLELETNSQLFSSGVANMNLFPVVPTLFTTKQLYPFTNLKNYPTEVVSRLTILFSVNKPFSNRKNNITNIKSDT